MRTGGANDAAAGVPEEELTRAGLGSAGALGSNPNRLDYLRSTGQSGSECVRS